MVTKILRIDGKKFELSTAEERFLEQCVKGEWAEFGAGVLPQALHDSVKIRAELVRFAMLGGNDDYPTHWRGPRLKGAWITGQIGLNLCKTDFALRATNCHFEQNLHLFDAEIFGVEIDGSWCPGITAYRLRTSGPVLMENAFCSTGEIDLDYARIDGRLGLEGAILKPSSGSWALTAEGARIRDEVSFSNLKLSNKSGTSYTLVKFAAHGPIRLRSMKIGGRFRLSGGKFKEAFIRGKVRPAIDADGLTVRGDVRLNERAQFEGNLCLRSASIDGQIEIGEITVRGAVDLNSSTIRQKLVLDPQKGARMTRGQKSEIKIDALDLRLATAGVLKDNQWTWNAIGQINISGLTYDDIESEVTWGTRMDDMILKDERKEIVSIERAVDYNLTKRFGVSPQPFTQWARYLDKEGHRLQASWVRYRREKLMRQADYTESRTLINELQNSNVLSSRFRKLPLWFLVKLELRRILDYLFGFFFGYGHKPGRAIASILIIWLGSVFLYGTAYDKGQMAPNSDVILVSSEWQAAVTHERACPLHDYSRQQQKDVDCIPPLQIWTGLKSNSEFEGSNASRDYENFNRYLYALDLFVPLDSLGQELAWVPARDRGMWGWWAYSLRWLIQMAGWIFTAVGAATITGLLARKE